MRRLTWLLLALLLANAALFWWYHDQFRMEMAAVRAAVPPAAPVPAQPALPGARIEPAFPRLQFERPLFLTHAPGDAGHLYVVTQAGVIYRFENQPEAARAEVFADLRARVSRAGEEEGLLGLAFDPAYADNGYFYVYYSAADGPRRTVVAQLAKGSGEARTLLEIPQPYANHKGGWIGLGPDRMLYVAVGDGGSGNDPENRAQNPDELHGKILRLRTDGSVPDDNPFSRPVQCARAPCAPIVSPVWALGLRNPWRCSFDRADLWCADVGQGAVEEIDLVAKGGNYGWRVYEGRRANINPGHRPESDFAAPVYQYDHSLGCSIIGGYVYRGAAVPAAAGRYFYADYCSGRIWALARGADGATDNAEAGTVPSPTSFGVDADGELYVTSFDGHIYRLAP